MEWRERFENFTDDVETSLALMMLIDDASKKSGAYIQRNLQIGGSYGWEVMKKDVEKVCRAGIVDRSWRLMQAFACSRAWMVEGSMRILCENFRLAWMAFIIKKPEIIKKNFFYPNFIFSGVFYFPKKMWHLFMA